MDINAIFILGLHSMLWKINCLWISTLIFWKWKFIGRNSDSQTVCREICQNFPFQTAKFSFSQLSKFYFSNCQNFPFPNCQNCHFQTVKIFLFKLSKYCFSNCQNCHFQTVKNFPFQTVKILLSELSKFSFSNCQNFLFLWSFKKSQNWKDFTENQAPSKNTKKLKFLKVPQKFLEIANPNQPWAQKRIKFSINKLLIFLKSFYLLVFLSA